MSKPSRSLNYRPHIDGLRAIAILSVVCYHAGGTWLPGGFMGVDSFFVISGFLIMRILLHDLDNSSFSLLGFYKRRVLRIVPALVVVLLATSLAAMALLLPIELLDYSRSLINAGLSISNIYFWHSTDYFGRFAWHLPLLHTWSLAIEEQFYVVLPLLLFVFHKLAPSRVRALVLTLTLVSLVACWLIDEKWPTAAFYLLPTRAWELGIGCCLATWRDSETPRSGATTISILGAALLIVPMCLTSADSQLLWPRALPVCLGTALLLRFADRSVLGEMLSWRPLVFIGLISYSLYLWHWPILVFTRLLYGDRLSGALLVGAVGLSLVLSVASFHLVERPFRRERFRTRPALPVVLAGVACLGAVTVSGYVLRRNHRLISHVPEDFAYLAPYLEYNKSPEVKFLFREGTCQLAPKNVYRDYDADQCLPNRPGFGTFLVLGDSYGGHIWRGLSEAFPEAVVGQATAVGHRPLLEHRGSKTPCQELYRFIFDDYVPDRRHDVVFLAGRWQERDLSALPETIEYVRRFSKHVVVLGPLNEYEGDLPKLMIRTGMRNERVGASLQKPDRQPLDRRMKSVCEGAGGIYVSLYDIMCPGADGCVQMVGDVPMQFDFGHLTLKGSRVVAKEIRARLEGHLAR